MKPPRIRLALADRSRVYHPHEVLCGLFSVEGAAHEEVRAVELSVLWHTEGKGDEDMSVHFFERIESKAGEEVDFRHPRRFSTELPNSPLSYDGQIVKIRWCARARVFFARGKELTVEAPFQLGTVPEAQTVST